jgi:FtsP/CotA-like multicopper oxidase with cupredoxin domain
MHDVARLLLVLLPALAGSGPATARRLPEVVTNDNTVPAGRLSNGVLTLNLRAALGVWRPEGRSRRAIRIEAFGEGASPLAAPAPLIRVPEGTVIDAVVRNDLSRPLRLHGFCERGGEHCAALDVPAGKSRRVRFKSGRAGTYHYWTTTTGMPQQFRAADDTQLSGAFIVDPPGAPPDDRVFVITEWTSLTAEQLNAVAQAADPGAEFLRIRPDVFFSINGRSWPHTERLHYELADTVRWRIVNLSTQTHPMHLHGFYFEVDSIGDGLSDRALSAEEKSSVVTHLMAPGSTMTMTWRPEREGNWLFHCHVMTHVSPDLYVDGSPKPNTHQHDHGAAGMTGMVLGVTVRGPAPSSSWEPSRALARSLTLVMKREPVRPDTAPAYAFSLGDGDAEQAGQVPGPVLVLERGRPVEITLVNKLPEGTAIHWHGMELESYYDGVHGFGGDDLRVTPMIEPGDSFVVRFTPPRSGTFMYHTHLHDRRQLTSGLYGAMLVVEPGERFDDAVDHVFVLGRSGLHGDAPVFINERTDPQIVWTAGTRHRVRLINITPDDTLAISLNSREGPVSWRPLTKDGAPVPESKRGETAARQVIGVGETYDFEFEAPPGRRTLWLEVRSPGGKWHAQGQVIVK